MRAAGRGLTLAAGLLLLLGRVPDPCAAGEAAAALREDAVGMVLAYVEGGTYQRGDATGLGTAQERPVHPVAVSDFYLGVREVTVRQFRVFAERTGYRTEAEVRGWALEIDPTMRTWVQMPGVSWRNPGFPQSEDGPVVWVSWHDAARFARWLAEETGRPYRLPTEAEWEYAARERGRDLVWSGTSRPEEVPGYAWFAANSGGRPHPAGELRPNALGLHDMSGNVWEWCEDWQGDYAVAAVPLADPAGAASGRFKTLRGGSWRVPLATVRTTYRNGYSPDYAHSSIGFRLALPAGGASRPREL